MAQYQGQWDTWFTGTFEPVLKCIDLAIVAANRHPGQVGYSLSPSREAGDEESSL